MPDAAPSEPCCAPGDITVTKIHTGYLIGRVMDPLGPGPWWEYIAKVRTFADARHHALVIASRDGTRAWLHKADDDYELLTD
jgi:hypothetical protein